MTASATALLIVGDADMRLALREQCAAGMSILEAETFAEALRRLDADKPATMLVGDDIPDPGAPALAKAARAAGFLGPTILLARRETRAGDDFDGFMRRPLRIAELLSLIRARLETRAAAVAPANLGGRAFCETTQTLAGPDGAPRLLTEKETAILARLAQARGAVVPRDVLLQEIWGYNPMVTTHTLETHIHRLRRKIENSSRKPLILLTAESGYRLTTSAGDDDGDT